MGYRTIGKVLAAGILCLAGVAAVRPGQGRAQSSDLAWRIQSTPTFQSLYAVWGTSPGDLWVAGNSATLAHWDGARWQLVSFVPTTDPVQDLIGLPSGVVYVVVGGKLYKVQPDRSWSLYSPQPEGMSATSIWVYDEDHIFLGGESNGGGGTVAWLEGGQWSYASVPGGMHAIGDVYGFAPDEVFAVSSDGGDVYWFSSCLGLPNPQWAPMDSLGADGFALWGSAPDDVYAGLSGRIRRYDGRSPASDCTAEWADDGQTFDIYDIWGTGTGVVFAVGSRHVTDGGGTRDESYIIRRSGSSWEEMYVPTQGLPGSQIWSVWGADSRNVWAVGESGLILRLVPVPVPRKYVVNSTGNLSDRGQGDGVCNTSGTIVRDGVEEPECTLCAAIQEANRSAETDTIVFDIPETDPGYEEPGYYRIKPQGGGLPPVSRAAVIIGPTMTAAAAGLPSSTEETVPALIIDGSNADVLANGLVFSDSSIGTGTVGDAATNIAVGNFYNGIQVRKDNVRLERNWVGVLPTGEAMGNRSSGILVHNATGVHVGELGRPNYISGNRYGVRIQTHSGRTARYNIVRGNIVGDVAAVAPAAGGVQNEVGVSVWDAHTNEISFNEISNNAIDGVSISGEGSHDNEVHDNVIGTLARHNKGNGRAGVYVWNAPNNNVGPRNTIARNRVGVWVYRDFGSMPGNRIVGNTIGLGQFDNEPFGNDSVGVLIDGAAGTVVGGTSYERNVISANGSDGILATGGDLPGVRIEGNYIGTDLFGRRAFPNGVGVHILDAGGVHVGARTTRPGTPPGNVISGNAEYGVHIAGAGAQYNEIRGNLIGLDAGGTTTVPTGGPAQKTGVAIEGAPQNTLGDDDATGRNVISGNTLADVSIFAAGANWNRVWGNLIGTAADGVTPLSGFVTAPKQAGIAVGELGKGNEIGGVTPDPGAPPGNVIAGHAMGVIVAGRENQVRGNLIGPDAAGDLYEFRAFDPTSNAPADAWGNLVGVELTGPDNVVGGATTGDRNVISGFKDTRGGGTGIRVASLSSDANGNRIEGNYIGVGSIGTSRQIGDYVGEAVDFGSTVELSPSSPLVGIRISADDCRVGGETNTVGAPPGNVVSGVDYGVIVEGEESAVTGVEILGNLIGPGALDGVLVDGDVRGIARAAVVLRYATDNVVGGIDDPNLPGRPHNVISGNGLPDAGGTGVLLFGPFTRHNTIVNNYIGTKSDGTSPLENSLYGVEIAGGAAQNTVGFANGPPSNVIAYNREGVRLTSSARNMIARNRIHDNDYGIRFVEAQGDRVVDNDLFNNAAACYGATDGVVFEIDRVADNGGNTGIELTGGSTTIVGSQFTFNLGDAIRLSGGAAAEIHTNNVYNNAGMGVENTGNSTTADATGNWWGDASGPGGAGLGAGDEVSNGVDFSDWLTEPVSLVAAAGVDTLAVRAGSSVSVPVFFRDWTIPNVIIDVAVREDEGWLVSPGGFAIQLDPDIGNGYNLGFDIPAATLDGTVDVVTVGATPRTGPSATANDVFVLVCYTPALTDIAVFPDSAEVRPGASLRFHADGLDQTGATIAFSPTWSVTGGTISGDGSFVAGDAPGDYEVTVTDDQSGIRATAHVRISTGEGDRAPSAVVLEQNFPNPFNPTTTIRFGLPAPATVTLDVYNVAGQRVVRLLDGETFPEGFHDEPWDGTSATGASVASGVYFYRLRAGAAVRTKKMVLVR